MLLTKEDVRAAGGIVHSDGNVFFTSIDQLNVALLAKLQAMEMPEPEIRFVFSGSDWHRATLEYFKQSQGQTDCIAGYNAAQLQQAHAIGYAKGAAEQLSEPIYQYQGGDGRWIDQTKQSYDYNVKHGAAGVRIVYTRKEAK